MSKRQTRSAFGFWAWARTVPLIAVLLLGGYLSYRYHLLLREQRDLVDHTYEVITTIRSLFNKIVDAETGQRGYVITGDSAYLEPYRNALGSVPEALARLRELIADSPSQLDRSRQLEAALAVKLDELGHTVGLRRERSFDAARAAIVAGGGKQTMDAIRVVVVDELSAAESRLLNERWQQARRTERHILIVALFGAALSVITRVAMALFVPRWQRWHHRRRLLNQAAARPSTSTRTKDPSASGRAS